ncbi:sugar phosphate isomerase/epimerase family protein [Candidatus Laterigemmans baculatus]|uniref:sugar phosphate isomerase/epimerase family protein n=1 Tax=Candidatus Laterigemmans baculatus TaxID=2770505 RepID=UPI001F18923B|nr:sugar phosphate isomerase/epimerase [Candidatus Laterigemmans baculatus]
MITRRRFTSAAMLAAAAAALPRNASAQEKPDQPQSAAEPFALHYIVASCMYGTAPLAEIVPEVPKTGARFLEIWDRPHGSQREQIDAMGEEAFAALLAEHDVQLGSFTCFRQGIFQMQPEMQVVRRLGGDMVICNSGGPTKLSGDALKSAVRDFAEKLRPHVAAAERIGVILGVENHGNSLIQSADSQRMLLDAIDSPHLGIALAPYHLPQDPEQIARLIRQLGPRLVHFQAWQHGNGCHRPMPKAEELLQMPGRGPLDFEPLLAALEEIGYTGRTEIFMHPTPRGVPILDSTAAVTAEINRARHYLEQSHQ